MAQSVGGMITDTLNGPLVGVRVTLYNADTSFFAETRSDPSGIYQFVGVPADTYTLNASRADLAYTRSALVTNGVDPEVSDVTVYTDTMRGRWNVLMNSPEPLGGTNLCTLLPDGRLFYCHNTTDPFLFDPATNQAILILGANAALGCVGLAMRTDSTLVFIGGADQDVYGPGTKFVKTWNSGTGQWSSMIQALDDFRWYPSTTTLPDGRVLTVGGGNEFNPQRTNSTELLDPFTLATTTVDSIAIGNEQSPIVVLYDGTALMTHRPPQIFDPASETWSVTGDFVQGNRMPNGDHADHELVVLPEGDVVAIGFKSFTPGVYGNMVEFYDPVTGMWSMGANSTSVRSRPETILLPNKHILVLAGEKEDPSDPTPVNAWNYTKLAHYYDPYADTWRRLKDMNRFREYHATAVQVPDGRIIVVGGEGSPGNEPSLSVLEAFTPPYLFKGIRPTIAPLADRDLVRGESVTLNVGHTNALTGVILQAQTLVTHMMNCGNNRFVELPFTQVGTQAVATLTTDALVLPDGFYLLTAMVDDIPSVSQIIRITQDFTTTTPENEAKPMGPIVYPNPSTGHFWIRGLRVGEDPSEVVVHDAVGRVVLSLPTRQALTNGIDLSNLVPGMYSVRLSGQGKELRIGPIVIR